MKTINPIEIRIFFIIILGLILAFFWKFGCNTPKSGGSVRIDTTILHIHDSTIVHEVKNVVTEPVNSKPYVIVVNDKEGTHDTVFQKIDSAAVVNDYYRIRDYTDTNHLKYGDFIVSSKVTQNKILGQSVKADFQIPEITKTITLPEKPQVYAGVKVLFSQRDLLHGFGVGLIYKSPKASLFELTPLYLKSNQFGVQLGYYKLISFNK